MTAKWMRRAAMTVLCGGLVFGGGCGALITDTLLRVGLESAITTGLGLGGVGTG